jgi:hypothetical protein
MYRWHTWPLSARSEERHISVRSADREKQGTTMVDSHSPVRRPPVDVMCEQCGKPMIMMSFNYTTLERGFESISLRCPYCGAEETRPFPNGDESIAIAGK